MESILYLAGAVLAGACAALPLWWALAGHARLARGAVGAVASFGLLMAAIAGARLALGSAFVAPSVLCVLSWLALVTWRALRTAGTRG